jgi:rSAM/selenodomain-associated transferase 2
MTPGISIVVPALDEAGGIGHTLRALQSWRDAGHELIVVDGGSRDATAEQARPWADQVLVSERGRARQMNAGAAAAQGAVLLFLHADTRLPAAAEKAVLQAVSGGAAWGRFDVTIEGRSVWLPIVGRLMNWRSRWTGIATGDQAMFVRRADFDAVGGFPEQPLMEDIELSRRLRARAWPACLRLHATTSGRRWDDRGAWRTILLMWRLRLLYALGTPAERLAKAYR